MTPGKPDILTHRHTDICVKARRRKYAHLYINTHSSADSHICKGIHDIRTRNDQTMTQKHTSTDIQTHRHTYKCRVTHRVTDTDIHRCVQTDM